MWRRSRPRKRTSSFRCRARCGPTRRKSMAVYTNVAHCAGVGQALAKMHLAGRDFGMTRANALSVSGWRPLFDAAAPRADELQHGLRAFLAAELDRLEDGRWPQDLPQGVIHADLF